MPTDSEMEALDRDLKALRLATRIANNLCDILAIQLVTVHRWLSFCGGSSPAISTAQVERLLDIQVAFTAQQRPVIGALLTRPGISPGFSRNLFGQLRPAVRRLPRTLRKCIASFPDHTLRVAADATVSISHALIGVAILDSFSMATEDAASLLQMFLSSFAIRHPEALASLPEKVKAHLSSATVPQLWFSHSHQLLADFSSTRQPAIIDMGRALGQSQLDLLKSLAAAVETHSTAAVRDAIRSLRAQSWFFATSEIRPLPTKDFSRLDGTLSFATLLRHARKGQIIYDSGEYAILDASSEPNRRYFLRFPSYATWFAEEPSDEHEDAYRSSPLRFALRHSPERVRSSSSRAIHAQINLLESFRSEVAVAGIADLIKGRVDNLARAGAASVPEAAFTATAYFLVARQLGMNDAPTIAALEGFVHLLIRTFTNVKRQQSTELTISGGRTALRGQ